MGKIQVRTDCGKCGVKLYRRAEMQIARNFMCWHDAKQGVHAWTWRNDWFGQHSKLSQPKEKKEDGEDVNK